MFVDKNTCVRVRRYYNILHVFRDRVSIRMSNHVWTPCTTQAGPNHLTEQAWSAEILFIIALLSIHLSLGFQRLKSRFTRTAMSSFKYAPS